MFTYTVSIIGVYDVDMLIQDSEKKLPKKETERIALKARQLTVRVKFTGVFGRNGRVE